MTNGQKYPPIFEIDISRLAFPLVHIVTGIIQRVWNGFRRIIVGENVHNSDKMKDYLNLQNQIYFYQNEIQFTKQCLVYILEDEDEDDLNMNIENNNINIENDNMNMDINITINNNINIQNDNIQTKKKTLVSQY